jgi:hypothetical protein
MVKEIKENKAEGHSGALNKKIELTRKRWP